ncbi:MAG: hypothetical protein GX456_13140, partial [Verrucomicrobia bacterium]|nr:hypothetical protein [Verrucomicrobiota bacterium]
LPEFADVAALPPFDWSGWPVVGLGMGEVVLDGPVADLGAIQLVVAQARTSLAAKL